MLNISLFIVLLLNTIHVFFDTEKPPRSYFKDFKNYTIKYTKVTTINEIATKNLKKSTNNYVFYLTNKPIYHKIHNVEKYSIKGLSIVGGNCSIVTLKNKLESLTIKIIKHEFAHGKGLPHCIHKNCVMNDAKGKISNLKNCNEFKESCRNFMLKNTKLSI